MGKKNSNRETTTNARARKKEWETRKGGNKRERRPYHDELCRGVRFLRSGAQNVFLHFAADKIVTKSFSRSSGIIVSLLATQVLEGRSRGSTASWEAVPSLFSLELVSKLSFFAALPAAGHACVTACLLLLAMGRFLQTAVALFYPMPLTHR